jgi:diguanylate cyclase (GGDEF)-like protein
MTPARSITPSFALKVVTPSLVAVGSIALLLLYIVNGIFQESNRLDAGFSQRLANSALGSLRDSLETVLFDNAVWDDAAEKAGSQTVDTAWADETWGVGTELGVYDSTFIIGPGGETLYSASKGQRLPISASEAFGRDLAVLAGKANSSGSGKFISSGIVRVGDTFNTVGVARIMWSTKIEGRDVKTANSIVFSKPIDGSVLSNLARRYAMEDLRFVGPGEAKVAGSVDVMSPSGETIGQLIWKDRKPGDVMRSKYHSVVAMLIMMFLFMIAVLLYMTWKGFKEAQDSHADALAASIRDDLTGLANRREMLSALDRLLHASRRNGRCLSVIYADLDGFKEVNDSYGHEIGDMLLKAAAAGFAYLAREAEVVARLGGDEFAIIAGGKDCATQARLIAQQMIEFLEEPMVLDGRIASVSVSIGIVDIENDDADVKEIIRRADVAMYAAKSQGRNCANIYQKSLDFKRDENRAVAAHLRQHLLSRSLSVVYQPIVDARSRKTRGVEALVRWPRDAESYYTPDVFIPVAEEFGLIEELGLFVLTEACRQAAQWPEIFVSVNVSPIQFMNPNFAELVAVALASTGLEARRLELEVTEGFIIDNASRASTIINRLHDMQVKIALDDFGTGFSSIGHLRRFKFDKLKLDRSMVIDILRQPSALRLVQGTIAMADALGLTVVAEGIEDENQVSVLRLAGCSQFQGYLFSKPVEAHDVARFLPNGNIALAS